MPKVTSFDVARRAGVSQPTVSRALRNLPGASAETRARVLAAAAELAYIPSESGRALSTSRTRRVAVVSEELTNPYYPELVEPIRRHLADEGLRAVLVPHTERGDVGLDVLADGSYDGVVLTTTHRTSTLPRDLTERGIRHVLANRVLDRPESPSCSVDNAGGVDAVAGLLVGLGHREIASLQGPVTTSTGRERAASLRVALRSRGVALPRHRTHRVAFDHDASQATALALLDRPDRPTAVVCGNDVVALGVLSAARVLGIRVPEQLSVIGFDDIRAAGWPIISLTTVRCDLEQLARTAVELLLAELGDAPPTVINAVSTTAGGGARRLDQGHGRSVAQAGPRTVRTPVSLVLRGTHAPPPAAG